MKKSLFLIATFLTALPLAAQNVLPANHRDLTKTTSYAEMQQFLESVEGSGPVKVSTVGKTVAGRNLYLVKLARDERPVWKILFYAQQHGDELSGKDALLYLIRDIAADPTLLPKGTAVWILPMMNPDGAEAGTRVNGAGADLNRDHITLEQPETQALHRIVQQFRPDMAVDCHEFARESASWKKKGWAKWPDITFDRMVNPLFDPALMAIGDRWLAVAAEAEKAAGHAFYRYTVGGAPPDEEQRFSAPDIDSGMNAVAAYGGLSFIIEAAARREAVAQELGNRVDAYLVLLRRIVADDVRRSGDAEAIRRAARRPVPEFVPTNYLWVNTRSAVTRFPVLDLGTRQKLEVPTTNVMTDLALKKSVPAPLAYAIDARAGAEIGLLLERHAVPFETLAESRKIRAERCTLVRVEDDFDETYSRYEGRQIVTRAVAAPLELPAGTLWVPLAGESAVRAALLLEPMSLYGLYQYPRYRALVAADGTIPVLRVVR